MQQRIASLRKVAQNIENFQIANLLNDNVKASTYVRMQKIKEDYSRRADFLESRMPKKKKPFSLKPLILSVFPTAYYVIGR